MRCTARLLTGLALMGASFASAGEFSGSDLQSRVATTVCRDLGFAGTCAEIDLKLQSLTPDFRLPVGASFYVSSVKSLAGPNAFMVRVECSPIKDCVPFHVLLSGKTATPVKAGGVPDLLHEQLVAIHTRLGIGPQAIPHLVRSGQRVRVQEELSGMRLSVPAVCLQPGAMGQKIRVRNVATGKVLIARVLSAQQLVVEE